MMPLPSGVKYGQKFAAPLSVICRLFVPSAFMMYSSMRVGLTKSIGPDGMANPLREEVRQLILVGPHRWLLYDALIDDFVQPLQLDRKRRGLDLDRVGCGRGHGKILRGRLGIAMRIVVTDRRRFCQFR